VYGIYLVDDGWFCGFWGFGKRIGWAWFIDSGLGWMGLDGVQAIRYGRDLGSWAIQDRHL